MMARSLTPAAGVAGREMVLAEVTATLAQACARMVAALVATVKDSPHAHR